MQIHVATDHAGLDFSEAVQKHLREQGHEVLDHGPTRFDPLDDYPGFCVEAAKAVAAACRTGSAALGIVFGGSGNGEQMAANKVPGIRAALVWSEATARLAREHNDANVLALGARQHELQEALQLIDIFIATPFTGAERHSRRIAQLAEYEQTGRILRHEQLLSERLN